MTKLADFKCHKVVKAGKILAFSLGYNGPVRDFTGPVTVEGADGTKCEVNIPDGTFARGRPSLGDYIVVYEDGYTSWSPAKVFEGGYTRL